ncbi:MAG: type II toxin-antitoxin system VapC family toxin [Acidobacteria bacterium]|nr:type II toxin-antitoxin system VapC family toxin [Acidobacteriota bacterium]
MRILLDTHAFLWWLVGSSRLVETARRAIADDGNDVLVSAASAWEIATKYRLGKLPEADALASGHTRRHCRPGLRGAAYRRR